MSLTKQAMPVIRYRTRDLTPAAGIGHALRRMAKSPAAATTC
jgi:phenylacetate-coenzyme A ligase PaaK-like adenylate-forming protein